jgi:hypothetical protein
MCGCVYRKQWRERAREIESFWNDTSYTRQWGARASPDIPGGRERERERERAHRHTHRLLKTYKSSCGRARRKSEGWIRGDTGFGKVGGTLVTGDKP